MLGGPPFGAFDPNNFALCFLCHDYQRLLGITVSRSNFFQSGSVGAGKGNLHYLHLVDKTNAACHECHNNVHSNVQAANTDYKSSLGTDTHLVNFAPNVRPFPGNDPYYGDRPTQPRYGRTPTIPELAARTGLPGDEVLGVVFDGVSRHTAEGYAFQRRAMEDGFRAAVRDRDEPFGDYGANPSRVTRG